VNNHNPRRPRPAASHPRLPRSAALPINRCNLPARLLGGLTFQRFPAPLLIDGVIELHQGLFVGLEGAADPALRRRLFNDHMTATFSMHHPEAAGFDPVSPACQRIKADYRSLLRGWMFDANSREAAVLKGWVESRFGLLAQDHGGPLRNRAGAGYARYQQQRAAGLYGANALEAQCDLLYSYCQYELRRRYPHQSTRLLYRGVNRIDQYERFGDTTEHRPIVLLNNLNSFSDEPERADEFGDRVIEAEVPLAKLLYFPGLLSDRLKGESEYLVIGGLYRVGFVR